MNKSKIFEFVMLVLFMIVTAIGIQSYVELGIFKDLTQAIEVFENLDWFIASFLLATLFTAYLVVVANIRFIFRFAAIPAWLALSFTLFVALDKSLGYPYPSIPPKAELIAYKVVRDKISNKRIIQAWMYLNEERRTRAYVFEHNPTYEETLYQAAKNRAQGKRVRVELIPMDKIKIKRPRPEDMIHHDIHHKGLPPKHYDTSIPATNTARPNKPASIRPDLNSLMLRLPDGTPIEITPGKTFTITPEGEIEISNPEIPKEKSDGADNDEISFP